MIERVYNLPISQSERTLIVCPIPREYSTSGPIREFRKLFPIDYMLMAKGMKPRTKDSGNDPNIIHELGSYFLTDFGEQKICWICIHSADHNKYNMDVIEDIIKAMAEDGLHHEFDMAFPLLGSYEVDGVDDYDVGLLIEHFFGDTDQMIDIHVDY